MSHDTIQVYLDSPLVPDEEIKAAGGVLKYWELAQMVLDFLSAPGQFLISTRLHTNLILSVASHQLHLSTPNARSCVDDCK